ncbi:hypothetical protein LMG10661_00777 [Ralstonia syzygii subsp. syzygii]|nr:hypothetical protein LMG10661_00777 [Ralstonia syzygii subsp. syzygii]
MSTNYTAGPWKYTPYRPGTMFCNEVSAANGEHVCRLANIIVSGQAVATANGRLIAAAPDLLEALQAMFDKYGYKSSPGLDNEVTVLARSAINKALEG